jgi:SAM-dependent methyltransferase
MASPRQCGICAGTTHRVHAGRAIRLDPESLAPTNHRPGVFGDLYECDRCGAVHQPSLPAEHELLALYREMSDPEYLNEEVGRRRTAVRLLDLIARHARSGRLLDVGCGHGLLLDEARARGYEVQGIDMSRTAIAHARDVLGVDAHEGGLELLDGAQFDAIVLADVIEHLLDPRGALERCGALLAPGGVLCVVTPDPSSLARRIAGRRWWGFLPAHVYLLPPRALRDLLAGAGLTVLEERAFVRTFSLRYWLAGLLERGGRSTRLSSLIARLPLDRLVSLSLGDERVVIALRTGGGAE